jgi:hypothetical protein
MKPMIINCKHGRSIRLECAICDAELPEAKPFTKLALIACSATKLDRPAPAGELYQGQLFRKAMTYAKRRCNVIRIISAKHGIVAPDVVLEPYDVTVADMTYAQRKGWSGRLRGQLEREGFKDDNTHILFLCGKLYTEGVQGRYRYAHYRSEAPLSGKGIGEQLAWLTQQNSQ